LKQIDDEPFELYHLEDLAHALRLIVDAETEIGKALGLTRFSCWKPTSDLRKALKRYRYFLCFFNRYIEIPNPPEKDMSVGLGIPLQFFNDVEGLGLYQTMRIRAKYMATDRLFISLTDKEFPKHDPYRHLGRKLFKEWLDSHLISVQYVDKVGAIKKLIFSRRKFLYRLSSSFGGSHPKGSAKETDENNLIEMILERKLAGFPVAYIVTYSVAADLMHTARPAMIDFMQFPEVDKEIVEPKRSTE
jgi:hypothetical protein